MTPEEAYARCEEITRAEARNFYYGIRLLPGPKRQAMSALYAMARRIDDVGDGTLPPDRKLHHLSELQADIDALTAGELPDPDDPVLAGLWHAADRFPIPIEALGEIVQGCQQDVSGTSYAAMDDTVAYCRLVAGSVGRLSLGVFGLRARAASGGVHVQQQASRLADDLGVALQLTNILRDIVEDRTMGRVYLPVADVQHFGCAPDLSGPPEALVQLIRHEAAEAERWFVKGLQLLAMLDHRSRACTAAMAGIYRRLLRRIAAEPAEVLRGRMSLPTHQKAWVAVRSLTGASV